MDTDPTQIPKTLTKEEMQEITTERVSEIAAEFTAGFKFLEEASPCVTFFGSTQFKEDNTYYVQARALGAKIVKELNYSVLTGGGPGIMEAASRGAYEAGGRAFGLAIKLPHPQLVNKYITNEIDFYYFFVRKVCLSFSAEAFIFFPGGYGTLDEFFEVLTLVQTKKVEGIPIICVGSDYWKRLENYIGNELLSRGTISAGDTELFTVTDDLDEVLSIVKKVPPRMHHSLHAANDIKKLESES